MIKIQNFIVWVSLLLMLASCTVYQVNAIDSKDLALHPQEDSSFLYENDDLKIIYSFQHDGTGMPLVLRIYNKQDIPVLLVLQHSAISINDSAVSLFNNTAQTTGTMNGFSIRWNRSFSSTYNDVNTNVQFPNSSVFIPPHSFITSSPVVFDMKLLDHLTKDGFNKISIPAGGGMDPVSGLMANYSDNTTPLKLRTFLSFVKLDKNNNANEGSSFSVQNNFYLSKIIQTKTNPRDIMNYPVLLQKNVFVLSGSLSSNN